MKKVTELFLGLKTSYKLYLYTFVVLMAPEALIRFCQYLIGLKPKKILRISLKRYIKHISKKKENISLL